MHRVLVYASRGGVFGTDRVVCAMDAFRGVRRGRIARRRSWTPLVPASAAYALRAVNEAGARITRILDGNGRIPSTGLEASLGGPNYTWRIHSM
jgi:hypothetical protein